MFCRLASLTIALVAIVFAMTASTPARPARAQQPVPQHVVEQYFAAINDGRPENALALLTPDAELKEVSFVSALAVGRDAFVPVFAQLIQWHAHGTLSDLKVQGNTVTGVIAWTMEPTIKAGVDRGLQPFKAQLNAAGLITRFDVTADTTDEQTRKYLAVAAADFEAAWVNPPPAGSTLVPLKAQAGGTQSGRAAILGFGDLSAVVVAVAPGFGTIEQPAQLRTGTCAKPGAIVHTIAGVVNGRSLTILKAHPQEFDGLILNVDRSSKETSNHVSCGEVLAQVAAPTPAPASTATPPAPVGIVAPSAGTGQSGGGVSPWWIAMLAIAGSAATVAASLRLRRS